MVPGMPPRDRVLGPLARARILHRVRLILGIFRVLPDGNRAISTANWEDSLLVSLTSGNVNAIAGDFFLTDQFGDHVAGGNVRVTLSDNTSVDLSSLSFYGFSTGLPTTYITSVEIQSLENNSDRFASLDDFYVAAVPEPSTWLTSSLKVLAIGCGAFYYHRRKTASA